VTLRAKAEPGRVRFEVADVGPGIAPEFHARLFEKHFRVPGTADSGTGLGLYIAKGLVTANGGDLGVESAPGRGSTFWFTVPRQA
jgi:signal transduction histidine kinase